MHIPLTWNATILAESGVSRSVDFRGKHVNFARHGNSGAPLWTPIAPRFSREGSQFVLRESPFQIAAPLLATGRCLLVNGMEWDVHRNTRIAAAAQQLTMEYPDSRPVEGVVTEGREFQVTYPNAFGDGIDLAYGLWHARGARGEHVIVFRKVPPSTAPGGTIDIRGKVSLDARSQHRRGGRTVSVAAGTPQPIDNQTSLIDGADARRGCSFRLPVAWYYDAAGNQITQPITCFLEKVGTSLFLVKQISVALIRAAVEARPGGELRTDSTLTVYPDPTDGSETSTVDGYTIRNGVNETWATIRAGAGVSQSYNTSPTVIARIATTTTSNQFNNLVRGATLFDATALGAGTPTAATVSLYGSSVTSDLVTSLKCYGHSLASGIAIAATDHVNIGSSAYSDTSIAVTSLSTSAYNDFAFNATGLAAVTAGVIQIGWRTDKDGNNTAPAWSSNKSSIFNIYSAEDSGTSRDPKLVITYDEAASGKPTHYLHLARQRG